jgi:4-diphosphocytidyl-2-C-methyl-D-erythritol kinase
MGADGVDVSESGASAEGATGHRRASAHDVAWNIPEDSSILVVRALEALRAELGSTAGCRVELQKNIPAAAGLGGGSSDAAAAIVAGLVSWGRWDRQLALNVGAALGSDIPLFFGDERNGIGLALVTGRGERVEMLSGRPPLSFAISHPPVGSSTAEVYKLWRSGDGHRSCAAMLAACAQSTQATSGPGQTGGVKPIEESLFNALQSPASQLTDWIERQLQCFQQLGKSGGLMSGSGSAVFSLVTSPDEGRKIVEKLIAFGLPRAYAAQAWYAPSIEQQLERIEKPASL